MRQIKDLEDRLHHLAHDARRRRVAVVCPHDAHTCSVIDRCLAEGLAEFLLFAPVQTALEAHQLQRKYPDRVEVTETETPDAAAQRAVAAIKAGNAEVLMKGLINTDNLLHAILDKEQGLLPKGNILTHIALTEIPHYGKLLFFSDAAVIPRPTLAQFAAMVRNNVALCRQLGIDTPHVALIECTEKVSALFPQTQDYQTLITQAADGRWGNMKISGPMDVKSALDATSARLKGLSNEVMGDADILIFPNIEAGNTFYKTVSFFPGTTMAGILCGTEVPCVVSSRADSEQTKYISLVLACLVSPIGK